MSEVDKDVLFEINDLDVIYGTCCAACQLADSTWRDHGFGR